MAKKDLPTFAEKSYIFYRVIAGALSQKTFCSSSLSLTVLSQSLSRLLLQEVILPGSADSESGCQRAAPAIKSEYINYACISIMSLQRLFP